VLSSPPTAVFSVSCSKNTCYFYGSGSKDDVKVVAWRWNFGDQTPEVLSATSSTKHTFATKGYFSVRLTVYDADGQSHSLTRSVKIERIAY
jgi:PKD repeat protein